MPLSSHTTVMRVRMRRFQKVNKAPNNEKADFSAFRFPLLNQKATKRRFKITGSNMKQAGAYRVDARLNKTKILMD